MKKKVDNKKEPVPFVQSYKKLLKNALLLTVFILLGFYFFSSDSRVSAVVIEGNHYLDDSYIEEISGISSNSLFYLNIPFLKEMKIKNDPMIESADVSLLSGNVVSITVKEKKVIGYRYEDDKAVILLSDNTKAELKSEYLDIIASVPLINGFTESEQTRLLCKAFNDVDQNMIENISEITQYSLSYDDEAMKIQMRNGSYFIGNYQNLDKLNQYYAIYSKMNDKSQCISADENTNVAYTFVCPWNQSDSTTEYWTDENGNLLTNQYGDNIAKHYYTDSDGNAAVDANGNQIAIPIDSNGTEVIDPNFNRNYSSGYYSTGTFVLPEGVSNEPEEDTTTEETTEETDDSNMPE